MAVETRAGKELPDNALTLDAFLPSESLAGAETRPGRIYFYERDAGTLLAHSQTSDGRRIYARAKELVVGFIATIGNYDYAFNYVFRLDGSFGFDANLNGLILNKTVAALQTGGDEEAFGTMVFPQMVGVTHQHWINLRLDFDIDGMANAIEERNIVALPPDPKTNPAGRALVVQRTPLRTAREAARTVDDTTGRTWVVFNPSKRVGVGHAPGYEIEPEGNTFSSIPARFGEPSSFVQRHLWVTPYDPEQLYAAGKYPNQYPRGYTDGLASYAGDQSIDDRDIVVWYSLGFTHVTRPEDFPIMPSERVTVNFKPRGFFAKTTTLGYARLDGATT